MDPSRKHVGTLSRGSLKIPRWDVGSIRSAKIYIKTYTVRVNNKSSRSLIAYSLSEKKYQVKACLGSCRKNWFFSEADFIDLPEEEDPNIRQSLRPVVVWTIFGIG
jgi:hypothetical protein